MRFEFSYRGFSGLLTSRKRCAVALQIRQNSRGRHLLNYSARAGRGVARERLLIASLKETSRLQTCETADGRKIFQETCFCRTGKPSNHEVPRVVRRSDQCAALNTCLAQSHFHRRRSVYTRCRTRPTNIFLGKILPHGIERPVGNDNALSSGLPSARTQGVLNNPAGARRWYNEPVCASRFLAKVKRVQDETTFRFSLSATFRIVYFRKRYRHTSATR